VLPGKVSNGEPFHSKRRSERNQQIESIAMEEEGGMALKNAGKFSVLVCESEPEAWQDGLKRCSFPNS